MKIKKCISKKLVEKNKQIGYINTGFVGTAYILDVLASHGYEKLAYDMLLKETYPSWLYQVNLGATTIWERWNSVLEDGTMNSDGMNSLNHYAYGSVVGWMYRYMCGLKPIKAGFKEVNIRPYFDKRLKHVNMSYHSPTGEYKIFWQWNEQTIDVKITIPFDCVAHIYIDNVSYDIQSGTYDFVLKL